MTNETTPKAQADLAQLMASRLCHDLISPLGAIGNGIELLEMSRDYPGIADTPEMKLIAEAVAAARARIQSFRIGFGQSGGNQRISRVELRNLLDGMAAENRMTIELDSEGDLPRNEVRMILLAVMCLASALPWGGALTVTRQGIVTRLTAIADRTRSDQALWSRLDTPQTGPLPPASEVQFPLLAEVASRQDRPIQWAIHPGGAEISF
jgi:histidine phosphotransferase ChpT